MRYLIFAVIFLCGCSFDRSTDKEGVDMQSRPTLSNSSNQVPIDHDNLVGESNLDDTFSSFCDKNGKDFAFNIRMKDIKKFLKPTATPPPQDSIYFFDGVEFGVAEFAVFKKGQNYYLVQNVYENNKFNRKYWTSVKPNDWEERMRADGTAQGNNGRQCNSTYQEYKFNNIVS